MSHRRPTKSALLVAFLRKLRAGQYELARTTLVAMRMTGVK